MLDKLFSSRTRIEILRLFLFNADNSFHQRQISGLTKQPIRVVQREVEKLLKTGFLEKSINGNRVYCKVNRDIPIFEDEYKELKEDVTDEEKAIDETLDRLLDARNEFNANNRNYLVEPAMGTDLRL